MKKFFLWVLIFLFFLSLMPIGSVWAQESESEEEISPAVESESEVSVEAVIPLPAKPLKAIAGADRNVAVGRSILLNAANSSYDPDKEVQFLWDFGDGVAAQGIEVTHRYQNPGNYRVILKVKQEDREDSDEIVISVDKDIVVLISDTSLSSEQLNDLKQAASTQEILLVSILEEEKTLDYLVSQQLTRKIIEAKDDINQAGIIVTYTVSDLGLTALLDAGKLLSETAEEKTSGFSFNNKTIVSITEKGFLGRSKMAQNVYNALQPQMILLINEDALYDSVMTKNYPELLAKMQENNREYQMIGLHTQRELSNLNALNFLSFAVNYMVNRGVPIYNIYLILILPVIATVISAFRQLIGIKAFGIYTPSIIVLSFLATGLRYGIIVFIVILLVATLGRYLARKIKILYLPRMAIVLTIVSLSILGLFIIGSIWLKPVILSISIFPILIMVVLGEKFVASQIEKGIWVAMRLFAETLVLSIICYYIANWDKLKVIILGYPELIFLTVIVNILIGRWAGLRLMEFIRFKDVIKNVEIPGKK